MLDFNLMLDLNANSVAGNGAAVQAPQETVPPVVQAPAPPQIQLGSYSDWVRSKSGTGLSLNEATAFHGQNIDFSVYGHALDQELQDELTSYFADDAENREEAIIAQQEIAGLFVNRGDIEIDEFIGEVRNLGYDVDVTLVETNYILDDKQEDGGGLEHGSINVLVIKDKDGNVLFKIADTNGNATIEVEEVFMNEIISNTANEIDVSNFERGRAAAHSSGSKSNSNDANQNNNYNSSSESSDSTKKTASTRYDRQKTFDDALKAYMDMGLDTKIAMKKAQNDVMDKFGTFDGVKVPDLETLEQKADEVSEDTVVEIAQGDVTETTQEEVEEITQEEATVTTEDEIIKLALGEAQVEIEDEFDLFSDILVA